MTWLAGRHTVKGGVDIQYVEYKDQISFFDGEELGRYEFDGTFTGNAFADFLLGLPRFTGYILPAPDVNPYSTYYAFFAQDDWRPTSTLTINYGLRYDLRPPMKDRSNQLGNFDRDFPGGRVIVSDEAGLALVPDFVRNSVPNTPFVTAEEAGLPETLRRTDKNNINPRLGIAWRPSGDIRDRHSRRLRALHGAAARFGELLDGGHGHRRGGQRSPTARRAPFVFPNISSAATSRRTRCRPGRSISVARIRST